MRQRHASKWRKVALITADAPSNLSLILILSLSPQQAGSCHESLTASSVGKWMFKYGAVQKTPFNTHRCSFHRHPVYLPHMHAANTVHKLPPTHMQYTQLHTEHLLGSVTHANATDVTDVWLASEVTRGRRAEELV